MKKQSKRGTAIKNEHEEEEHEDLIEQSIDVRRVRDHDLMDTPPRGSRKSSASEKQNVFALK